MKDGGCGSIDRRVLAGALWLSLVVCAAPRPADAQDARDTTAVSFTDTIPRADLARLVDAGSDVFNGGTCIFCHGVGARGSMRRAPDLTDVEWLHSDGRYEGILRTIFWGVKKEEMKAVTPRPFPMNPKGGMNLSGEDLRAVAAYVWSLGQGADAWPPRVAAQQEFLRLLVRGDVDEAIARFQRERRAAPDALLFGETAINRLGYEFLRQRSQPRVAIRILELNTELHPDSWNVWDSLAEAHMVAGDRDRAIELYEKSLALNPENGNAKEKLAELRKG